MDFTKETDDLEETENYNSFVRAKGKAIQHLNIYMFLFKDLINTRENPMGNKEWTI